MVDATTERLRDTFERYERLKGDRWDYDDFRLQAEALAQAGGVRVDADLIAVDGWREVGPVDLALFQALGRASDVLLSLPESPPGTAANGRLDAAPPTVACHHAPNPVAEARWVLRSLKRDLAEGRAAKDIAVIAPPRDIPPLLALAEEYGVPLADETPTALADTPVGRRLIDLLTLAQTPTAEKLLVIPELEALGRAAMEAGVAGADAVGAPAIWRGHTSSYGCRWGPVEAILDPGAQPRLGLRSLPSGARRKPQSWAWASRSPPGGKRCCRSRTCRRVQAEGSRS